MGQDHSSNNQSSSNFGSFDAMKRHTFYLFVFHIFMFFVVYIVLNLFLPCQHSIADYGYFISGIWVDILVQSTKMVFTVIYILMLALCIVWPLLIFLVDFFSDIDCKPVLHGLLIIIMVAWLIATLSRFNTEYADYIQFIGNC